MRPELYPAPPSQQRDQQQRKHHPYLRNKQHSSVYSISFNKQCCAVEVGGYRRIKTNRRKFEVRMIRTAGLNIMDFMHCILPGTTSTRQPAPPRPAVPQYKHHSFVLPHLLGNFAEGNSGFRRNIGRSEEGPGSGSITNWRSQEEEIAI